MPKNSSAARREAARALAAAEGISCTAALRRLDAAREAGSGQLPPGPAAAGVRVIDCTGFNGRIGRLAADDELIKCQGIWEHASAGDREETGPCEHWDYYAIGDAWNYSCHEFFDSQGAAWDPDAL
ncbi:MAG: hypothetical protein ACRDNT_15100, partial [Streptosporangiaceae bacterium]